MALDFPTADDFPGGVIPDGEEYEGFYWDASDEVWRRKCETDRDRIGDCLNEDENETVCDKLDVIGNLLVELEEEIDAIAPTLERGQWRFNPLGQANAPGVFGLQAVGTATNHYPSADLLLINSVEHDGNFHNFVDVEEGSYVEIFSPDDGDYGLYIIKQVLGETPGANSYWSFEIEHLRSNVPLADADADDICRIKFFKLTEGADIDTFVLKTGDTITCESSPIIFTNETTDSDTKFESADVQSKIRFKTENPDDPLDIKTVDVYQPGKKGGLMTDGDLYVRKNIYPLGFIKGYNRLGDASLSAQINLSQFGAEASLEWGSSTRLLWKSDGGALHLNNTKKSLTWGTDVVLNYDNDKRLATTSNGGELTKGTTQALTWGDGVTLNYSGNNRLQTTSAGGQATVGSNIFIKWSNTDNYLQYRGNGRLYWGSSGVSILKPVNNNTTAVGFKIKGSTIYNNNYGSTSIGSNDGSLLYVQHVNGQSDSIRYYGRQSDDFDLVTVKYVKDNAGSSGAFVVDGNNVSSNPIKITKTNGVYYITGG